MVRSDLAGTERHLALTDLSASALVAQRFHGAWQALLPIGRDAGTGGYRRYAWTAADTACRAWFLEEAHDRNLRVEPDGWGNLLAWWDVSDTGRDGAVLTGSHLDSVPDGGAFDGPLGVISSLCAVDLLRERGVTPQRSLAVGVFADEEGARFGLACVGSRLLSGVLTLPSAYALQDAAGITMRDAMLAAGVDLDAAPSRGDLSRFSAFVELHIEQGLGLAGMQSSIGIATAIWPHGRWRFTFRGEANHAGTTRLVDRHDPMLPFAATAIAARRLAAQVGAIATFGRVTVEPNATNGIPSAVHAWLDARAADQSKLEQVVTALSTEASTEAVAHGVHLESVQESSTPEVRFDAELRGRMAAALRAGGFDPRELPTGAGHDAGILSDSIPTGMLFVRNENGVSHSPAEHADLADCLDGVRALATVLEDLLRR